MTKKTRLNRFMENLRQNYRIYPNKDQASILNEWLGQCRFVWNHMLAKNIEEYNSTKKFIFKFSMNNLLPELKKQYEWMTAPAQSLQQKCGDLDVALKRCGKKQAKFPRFKSKATDVSGICFPQRWKLLGNKLFLPKMKSSIRVVIDRPLLGKPKSVILKKDKCGDFWISILVELPEDYFPEMTTGTKSIGVDVGIKEFAVLSDGTKINNPRFLKKSKKKLQRLQRSHSRKQKKSKNREKARNLLARQHRKVSRQRKDYICKTACSIAKNNDIISIEDLNVKGMMKNHKLAGAIADVSWGMFFDHLTWQCKKRGKHLMVIGRFFPSSKTCSECGSVDSDLSLKDRTYSCSDCGHEMDRDLNAAINIERQGLHIRRNTVGTTEIKACQVRTDYCSGQETRLL
jgi:putative transposase